MTTNRRTAADLAWIEKVDERASVVGAVVVLIVIAAPLMLL